jgi:hypothetical protein
MQPVLIASPAGCCPGLLLDLPSSIRLCCTGIVNDFAFEGKAQGRKFAEELVQETHEDWLKLVEERGKDVFLDK